MATTPSPTTTSETSSTPDPTSASSEPADAAQTEREAAETRDPEAQERSQEAARYRARLRDVEAERDALRERVERYERSEVEAIATREGMAVPSDLWTLNVDVPRADDGTVDVERVTEQVRTVLRERPTWRRERVDFGSGARASAPSEREPGLSQLLKPGRR